MNNTAEKEMIEKLKCNLAKVEQLPLAERNFLEGKRCLFLNDFGEWKITDRRACVEGFRYRLPPDYEPKKEGRFVEGIIVAQNNQLICPLPVDVQPYGHTCTISSLTSIGGFCGFWFVDGSNEWSLDTTKLDDDGHPLAPLKARFWIEGDK